MIPAIVVFLYLATVLYIGIFAFRRARGKEEAEDYFLASRSLGPFVFLFSLFGTNMTAFAILGSSGHAFTNGIVTFGLMASSSGLVIPLTIFFIGTRVWALGKKHGFMCGDAARIDDATKPFGETLDGLKRSFPVYRPSINCSLGCEVVCRSSHENIVFQKCYGRAI